MKIISVANQKGGVGKTTTVLNVGAGLMGFGKNVLIVDLDPQANLTASLGLNPEEPRDTMYHVFSSGKSILPIPAFQDSEAEGSLWLLPSSIDLTVAEMKLYGEAGRDYLLKRYLSHREFGGFDIALIDCPPNLGMLTINAFTASDYLIVPVQTEYLATRGFSALLDTLKVVRDRLNPNLTILGVLATMYDSRKILDREVVAHIESSFGKELFQTKIRQNVSLAEAPSHGKSIFTYKLDSIGTQDYRNLCKEILERMEGKHGKTARQ